MISGLRLKTSRIGCIEDEQNRLEEEQDSLQGIQDGL
jgi:hypothetical protein